MTATRLKNAAWVVTVIFSLVGATLASCSCSHHEAFAGPAEPSCHGPAHNTDQDKKAIDVPVGGDILQTGCGCLERQAGPILHAASCKIKGHQAAASCKPPVIKIDGVTASVSTTGPVHSPRGLTYDFRHYKRAPARAPPRL